MEATDRSVEEFIAGVAPAVRQRDAQTLVALMRRATGHEPVLWTGGIIGFGNYHYRYETGREGDAGAAGFAPRKAASTVYLPDGVGAHAAQLERLGPHTTGLVCVYLKDLSKVDLEVLEQIIGDSFRAVTTGTFTKRARDSAVS